MFIDYCKLTNSLTVDILGMNEKVLEIFFQTLEILTKPKCRIGINFSDNVTYCQIKDVLLEIGYILLREIIILYLIKNRGCHFVILTQICRLLLLATARGNEVEFL